MEGNILLGTNSVYLSKIVPGIYLIKCNKSENILKL